MLGRLMKRRHFVLGAAGAVGGLAVGWSLLPARQRLLTGRPLAAAAGQAPLNGYLKLGGDDSVVIVMAKSEMGQGVHTGLAMILAEELDADWSRVRVEPAPIDPIYFNQASVVDGLPFHPDSDSALKTVSGWLTAKAMREFGVMMTGGSSSLKDLWLPMRQAGASARAMLVGAAAQAWGLPADQIQVAAGVVSHAASGRSARFGELAARAAQQPLPPEQPLKEARQFKLIGQPLTRIEAAAKGLGTAPFAIDALPPGLLYASVVMGPVLGGKVARFDAAAALKLPGVRQVVAVAGHVGGSAGVAAIADTPWHAMKGVQAVTVGWAEGAPAAGFDSETAMAQWARLLDTEGGFAYFKTGDAAAAMKGAARTVKAEYRAPFLAHATMEPQNCTVQFKDGRATVWAPTQVPDLARSAVARVLGIATDAVDVQVQLLGGGFGRRLDVDFIAQAAEIAKAAAGAPVQTLWTREQDTAHDFYRPAAVARYAAGLDAQGRLLALHATSAGPSVLQQVLGRLFGLPAIGPDKTTAEGAFDQPYEWPAARIAHHIVDVPVPVGFWRSVGHSHQAFFKESFVDELAHAAGADAVAFRAALLQQHPRHLAVLQAAAQRAGWGMPVPSAPDGARAARGIALHQSFGSIVAQVAEVSLDGQRRIRVHRVVCAIDCGTPVNPGLIRQQMESGMVFGLSAALYGRIDIEAGRVKQSNFHDYPVLRIDACPLIEAVILPGSAPPEGVGEPGTPPIAPAVANAIFALTGERLRSLPLTPT
jgi:isoquinoline 1-oxidoreductase beta subunit